jgi:hypothetical protein
MSISEAQIEEIREKLKELLPTTYEWPKYTGIKDGKPQIVTEQVSAAEILGVGISVGEDDRNLALDRAHDLMNQLTPIGEAMGTFATSEARGLVKQYLNQRNKSLLFLSGALTRIMHSNLPLILLKRDVSLLQKSLKPYKNAVDELGRPAFVKEDEPTDPNLERCGQGWKDAIATHTAMQEMAYHTLSAIAIALEKIVGKPPEREPDDRAPE